MSSRPQNKNREADWLPGSVVRIVPLVPGRVACESGLNLLYSAFRSHDYLFVEHCRKDVGAELMQLGERRMGFPLLAEDARSFSAARSPAW